MLQLSQIYKGVHRSKYGVFYVLFFSLILSCRQRKHQLVNQELKDNCIFKRSWYLTDNDTVYRRFTPYVEIVGDTILTCLFIVDIFEDGTLERKYKDFDTFIVTNGALYHKEFGRFHVWFSEQIVERHDTVVGYDYRTIGDWGWWRKYKIIYRDSVLYNNTLLYRMDRYETNKSVTGALDMDLRVIDSSLNSSDYYLNRTYLTHPILGEVKNEYFYEGEAILLPENSQEIEEKRTYDVFIANDQSCYDRVEKLRKRVLGSN